MTEFPRDTYAEWRAAYELLQSGEYERATDLLRTVQMTYTESGNMLAATTAGAARQLCLALMTYQTEIEWHQLARGNAQLREQTLSQHLRSMMTLFDDQTSISGSLPTPAVRPDSAELTAAETTERTTLWQRLQSLFDRQRRLTALSEQRAIIQRAETPLLQVPDEASIEQVDKPMSKRLEPEAPSGVVPSAETDEFKSAPSASAVFMEEPHTGAEPELPGLTIYCLGAFRVYQNGQYIEDWNGQKGVSILKYLIAHYETSISKDVLMDVFWPDADPEAARRNLHQAIYSLRQTLRRRDPHTHHIRFENNQYLLNPELRMWVDMEEFEAHMRSGRRLEASGQRIEAIVEYSIADSLFQGDFLEEDVFEEWALVQRQHLRNSYLEMADRLGEQYLQQGEHAAAIALCQKILTLDNCDEAAHRRLMRAYLVQGQRHLAIRQYHTCVQALQDELGVPPAAETTALYEHTMSPR